MKRSQLPKSGNMWVVYLLLLAVVAVVAVAQEPRRQLSFQSPRTAAQNESDVDSHKHEGIVKAMNLKTGQVVVDIGAGEGHFTRRFAEAVGTQGKAIGVDIDPAAIRVMTADSARLGMKNYEARLVPPDDPMLHPQSADVLFLSNAYHHLTDRAAYFARVKPALRPGGRVVIVDMVKTHANSPGSDELRFSREEVIAEFQQAGYQLVKEFDFLQPKQYFLEFAPMPALRSPVRKAQRHRKIRAQRPAKEVS